MRKGFRSNLVIPLILFCLFALLAMAVTTVSIKAYQRESVRASENYASRTISAYVTEKVRQSGGGDRVQVGQLDGRDALVLTSENDGKTYMTYIYQDGESLREVYVEAGVETHAGAGTEIIGAKAFSVSWARDHLLKLTYTDGNGRNETAYVHTAPEEM